MRIVWIGPDRDATFGETAGALRADARVTSFQVRPIVASAASRDASVDAADGVVLAVHHFEPATCAWFESLLRDREPARWRAALGPFAATAGRVPFDALHRQGLLTANGPVAASRWLDELTARRPERPTPARVLVWSPSEDRGGIDTLALGVAGGDERTPDVRLVTPRSFGLPFAPDAVVAWVPFGLGREERVHLGQLRGATPSARWIAAYASSAASRAAPLCADAVLVWPFALGELRLAVERACSASLVDSTPRAA